jgi:hypothetical protein
MKVFKILLGVLFGGWALGTLVLDLGSRFGANAPSRGMSDVAALAAVVGALTLFSVWSFQSAFRKPANASEEDAAAPPSPDSHRASDA